MAPRSMVTSDSGGARPMAAALPLSVVDSLALAVSPGTPPSLPAADPSASSPHWFPQLGRLWRQVSSCLVSMAFHATVIIVLGLWSLALTEQGGLSNLVASLDEVSPALIERITSLERDDLNIEIAADNHVQNTRADLSSRIQADLDKARSETGVPQLAEVGIAVLEGADDLLHSYSTDAGDTDVTGALAGRLNAGVRAQLVEEGGGTPASEDAVARGLRWLEVHQNRDGSWHFNLVGGNLDACTCRDSSTVATTTAATGLALLAFLGRGNTHQSGEYRHCVKDGLYYLMSRLKLTANGGDLRGKLHGQMYDQGIAAIVLAEAYALTRDKELEEAAQQAIDFIVFAQHKAGGGWRYSPGMPGDTTVTGWQMMALKSGQMAYLHVPGDTIQRAIKFLDSVQLDKGARYGYMRQYNDGQPRATSAIGLLLRMYTGWNKDHPTLRQGVELLSKQGPRISGKSWAGAKTNPARHLTQGSGTDMYYNYYGTQVMHHWGGNQWENWNYVLREYLIETQASDGHESGSWYFAGGHGKQGGRLYNTCLAVMTLEVYYRHLPIYRAEAAGDGF